MGTSINDMRERFASVNFNQVAEDALYDSRDVIKELQVDQLKRGVRKDGSRIGKYKNKAYAAKKHQLNPLAGFGNVDLILKGDFKSQIFVDVREDVFVIDSGDEKAAKLISDYGDPFGLTDESNAELIKQPLQQNFEKRAKEKLRL